MSAFDPKRTSARLLCCDSVDTHHKSMTVRQGFAHLEFCRDRSKMNSRSFATVNAPIVLPWPLRSGLEAAARVLFDLGDQSSADFLRPPGEAALVSPESVSWRVFKNPLSLFIGGVAAVIMELAEPRVRTGVWEHTTFRIDPIRRLRRTGLAAMV